MLGSSDVVVSTIQRVYSVLRGNEVTEGDDPNLDDYVPDAPSPSPTPRTCRPRRSTSSSSTRPTAPSTACGVGPRVLRRPRHRPDRDPGQADVRLLPAEPRLGVHLPPVRRRPGQRRLRPLPDPHEISDRAATIDAGTIVPKIDRRTRQQRLEAIEEDLEYTERQLDRAVTAKSQIRLVLETFRDRLFTEIFPGRSTVPKTLIFAKDDAHAEEIVTTVREVFGKGNDFAAKITYAAKDPKGHLQAFRTSPTLRVAVTVDMIATGTDVKPLECVFFMRDVRSAQYFEQMKGRGARTIAPADFQSVTPDATAKTCFVIVDAVGVTEHEFVDPPLNRDKAVPLKKLLDKAANLTITEDETATLASRLAKLELELTPEERTELDEVAGGSLRDIVRALVDAVDQDARPKRSRGQQIPTRHVGTCSSRQSRHSPPTPTCGPASSNSAPPTTGSSTRSASTSSSTLTESSTPTGPSRWLSPGLNI
jgi:type I restriction enzyme R subunit